MTERSYRGWSRRRRLYQPKWPPSQAPTGRIWNPRGPFMRFDETGDSNRQGGIYYPEVADVETAVATNTRRILKELEKTTSVFHIETTTTTTTTTSSTTASIIQDIEKVLPTVHVSVPDLDTNEQLHFDEQLNNTEFFSNSSNCSSNIIEASHAAYLYGIIFLIVVSLLLNSLSIIIFQSKGLRRYPFSLYLVVIGVVDTLSLCSYIPRKWLTVLYMALGYTEQKTFYDTNKIACKAFTYVTYVLRFLSSWLLVAAGTDRLLVASTPYKRSKYPTLQSAQHGLCYCAVAAVLFNAHVLFVWDSTVVPGDVTASCVPMSMSPILALGLTILTVVLIVGLPFVVIGGLAIMIVRNLPAWNLRPRRLSSTVIGRALFEKDATIMVVSILVAYCVLCVPYIITWIVLLWQHFMDNFPLCRYIDGAAARDIAEVVFMVNFAIKFLLCIFFGGDVLNQK